MDNKILNVLDKKSDEILKEWQERVAVQFPNWEEPRLKRLIFSLKEFLVDYLKNPNVDVIIQHVEKIINTFYLDRKRSCRERV